MKLYKYICFDNEHWRQPAVDETLYFSSSQELQRANDRGEFMHTWQTDSTFFNRYGNHFSEGYDRLFSATRVLCLGLEKSESCWRKPARRNATTNSRP
ncbi:hypothetical protein BH10BDE1_BH10BDE1_13780 [soil metagenome]